MKIKIPAREDTETEVCDICHRGGYLQTCKACGGKFCIIHDDYVPGCIHKLDICRTCSDRPEVITIAANFAPKIKAVLNERDAELAKLCNADIRNGEPKM